MLKNLRKALSDLVTKKEKAKLKKLRNLLSLQGHFTKKPPFGR